MFNCPFCDGWEHRDQPVVVIDAAPGADHLATLVRSWTPHVTVVATCDMITAFVRRRGLEPRLGDELAAACLAAVEANIATLDEGIYTALETEARERSLRDPRDWPVITRFRKESPRRGHHGRLVFMDRDVELAELGLQNQATWKVLDFAVRSREASTRLHGIAVGLLPFASAAVGFSSLLIYSALGAAFLSVVGINSFITINGLRMLQFRLAVEEGRSRTRLRGGLTTYGTEIDVPTPPPLAEQMDPMGNVTRSARWVAAVDLAAPGPLLASGLIVRYGNDRPASNAALVIAAAALSAVLVVTWLVWSGRHSRRTEHSLAADLRGLKSDDVLPRVTGASPAAETADHSQLRTPELGPRP